MGLVYTRVPMAGGDSSLSPGHAEAVKAAGMSPGPCSEASPILVGSKASSKPVLMPSEVTSPPGWGGAGHWHSMAARSEGTTLCPRNPCLAAQPRDLSR